MDEKKRDISNRLTFVIFSLMSCPLEYFITAEIGHIHAIT